MNGKWLIALLPIVVGLLAIVPVIKADNVQVTASVPPYVSVVFNYDTVNFGNVVPGSIDFEAPNAASGIYNVSVATNVLLNVSAYRTAWSPSDVLTLKISTKTIETNYGTYTLTTTPEIIATLPTGSYTHYHDYWLTVPVYAAPGTYSTTVTITYSAS